MILENISLVEDEKRKSLDFYILKFSLSLVILHLIGGQNTIIFLLLLKAILNGNQNSINNL